MKDYKRARQICQENSQTSERLLDNFLLYYAGEKSKLSKEADRRMEVYKHVLKLLDKSWQNMLKSQYIMFKVMKQGGFIHKYLNHSAIKELSSPDREWLSAQAETPWRFSFSILLDNPEKDFFEMQDAFTGEEFLLYSPGLSKTLKGGSYLLFFNLIGYNGTCWQTYGPLAAYPSFDPDDIFFYATEVNPTIESDEDMLEDIEKNPVPYMVLFAQSNYPLTVHGNHILVTCLTVVEDVKLPCEKMTKDFELETVGSVHRLKLKNWCDFPHFSVAYYEEASQLVQVTAMTDDGFKALVKALNNYGIKMDVDPDIYLKPSMHTAAQTILKREIELMPLELLFEEKPSTQPNPALDNLNKLLMLAIPAINAGEKPDIEELAEKAGIDIGENRENINELFEELLEKRKQGKS
ncbi:hypothetical protein [Pleomorphovibrio marinus]|uniref:hypothetical protein n=1 Tax=Pleomorphovibrio marinus TaxID=2164132 RepID=UPI000E0A005C|nr:hypothetical protein [Pleomorphovibrio marinus]